MQKILIVEDDTNQLNLLIDVIKRKYPSWTILYTTNYQEAALMIDNSILESQHFSLFLLDIQLMASSDNRDGFAIAQYIREQTQYFKTPILFLTSVSDESHFALSNYHCYNYIAKPYTREDIIAEIEQMLVTGYLKNDSLEIADTNRILHRVNISDIHYIKSGSHTLEIYTSSYIIKSRQYSMEAIFDLLDEDFIRCHKQYIVNRKYIISVDKLNKYISVPSNKTIPLGKMYIDNL